MTELKKVFQGRGEVKGYSFAQLFESDLAFMYELTDTETGSKHYEVFERKINKQFDCISYPRSKAFGVWAWCITDYNKALEKYNYLSEILNF